MVAIVLFYCGLFPIFANVEEISAFVPPGEKFATLLNVIVQGEERISESPSMEDIIVYLQLPESIGQRFRGERWSHCK